MKFRIGVAAASIALVAAGCGGSDVAEGSLGNTVLAAVTQTAGEKTSKATMKVTINGAPQQTAPVTVTMDGALNYETSQGSFTATVPTTEGSAPVTTQMIIDGTTSYTQLPTETATQLGGKSWVKVDAAEVTESAGIDINSLAGDTSNPSQGLDMLKAVSDDVTKVGKEDLRGDSTTHYKVTLDFTKAAEDESDETKKQELLKVAQLYGNKPLPADVWIDGDDRVRKLTYVIDMSTLQVPTTDTEPTTGTIALEMEFFEFGTDLDVQVPPVDQVIDSAELQRMAAQQTPAAA